jgi:c-di-GMP-binding flagellar brake protein YcgR
MNQIARVYPHDYGMREAKSGLADVRGGEDDRRWERQSVVIPVNVTVVLEGQRHSFRGQTSDISRGGMRLFLTRELPFGTSLTLEFLMPYNTMQLVVRGVIRNRDGFTHGVEFLNPTDQQQQLIERTCKIFQLLS